jgi:hypothetical protein
MSETDDDYQESGYLVVASLGGDDKDVPQNKKRKIQRACDVCRRKKVSKPLGYLSLPIRVHASSLGAKTESGPRAGWPLFHGRLGRPDLSFEHKSRCMGRSCCTSSDFCDYPSAATNPRACASSCLGARRLSPLATALLTAL